MTDHATQQARSTAATFLNYYRNSGHVYPTLTDKFRAAADLCARQAADATLANQPGNAKHYAHAYQLLKDRQERVYARMLARIEADAATRQVAA